MSRRLLVSSVVRGAGVEKASGFLHQVDLDHRRATHRCSVPESAFRSRDPNPRGGSRGVRGLASLEDRLVIANAERLMVYDPDWKPIADLSHPLLGGIHDVVADPGGVWAASTSADLLVRLDWSGRLTETWDWRQDQRLVRRLGFEKLPAVDLERDYRDPESLRWGVPNVAHLNGVSHERSTGALLVSLGRVLSSRTYRRLVWLGRLGRLGHWLRLPRVSQHRVSSKTRELARPPASHHPGSASAILRVEQGRNAELVHHSLGLTVPNHNVLQLGSWLIYNDSNSSSLVAMPTEGQSVLSVDPRHCLRVEIPGHPSFVRGLVSMTENEVWVGNQAPLAIYRIELRAGQIVERHLLGGHPRESTYALCELPDSFADLPRNLLS